MTAVASSRKCSTPTTPRTEHELTRLLAAVPDGWTRVRIDGRTYGLTRTSHAGGRSLTIHAEELGGSDVISANVWRTSGGDLLRPCEMPAEKVLGFLTALAEADTERYSP